MAAGSVTAWLPGEGENSLQLEGLEVVDEGTETAEGGGREVDGHLKS